MHFDQVEFADKMRAAYNLTQGERDALTKSKETLTAIQQNSQGRAQAAFASVEKELTAKAGEFMPAIEIPETATPEQRAELETYNNAIKNLPAVARQLVFDSKDEKSIAVSGFKAAAYDVHVQHVLPRILKEYEGLVELNKKLTGEVAAIRSRNPNLQRHATASADNGNADPAISGIDVPPKSGTASGTLSPDGA